jgi:hypothetical protein
MGELEQSAKFCVACNQFLYFDFRNAINYRTLATQALITRYAAVRNWNL